MLNAEIFFILVNFQKFVHFWSREMLLCIIETGNIPNAKYLKLRYLFQYYRKFQDHFIVWTILNSQIFYNYGKNIVKIIQKIFRFFISQPFVPTYRLRPFIW